MRSAATGTSSCSLNTNARLPLNLNADGNIVLNESTNVVWQLKYIAYCVGRALFHEIRMALPLFDCALTKADSPHLSVYCKGPTLAVFVVTSRISARNTASFLRIGGG